MILYILCYFLVTIIFISIGKVVVTKFDLENKYDFFDFFFIGICVVGAILNIWSLFFPTNILSFLFLIILSFFCLFYIKKKNQLDITGLFVRLKKLIKSKPYFILAILISLLFILFSSIVTPRLFDSHLYHIGAIKWNEMYNVALGHSTSVLELAENIIKITNSKSF